MKESSSPSGLNFKKSNIRIWIHQRNMANLQQVVWEGHGQKLLVEHSNNTKVRKFLDAVPYIMGLIKDVHCDVQNGDLDSLKNRIAPPIPIAVLTAKDANGLTPLHKAVGLGKDEIARYIVSEVPSSVTAVDNEGRTPLHYAALLKDDQKMFNYLIENGADESALDNRQKTAAYYKTRTSELDSKLLHVVPDCPRGAKEPTSFDWSMLATTAAALPVNGVIKKTVEKIANGVKEKLDIKDSSETVELEELNEAKDSPKENVEEEDIKTPEKEDEQSEENNVPNTEDDHGKEDEEEEHERSIEEPAKESDKNEDTEIEENNAVEDTNQNDTEGDNPEYEITKNKDADAIENPDHTSDSSKHEDEEKEEDEPNDAENESKPEAEGDPDNVTHSDEDNDEKEENNNEPDSNPSENEPVSEQAEEHQEGSRTRPSSRQTHSHSASKSRPISQAGSRSRPSTGIKHTPENDHDSSDEKHEGEEDQEHKDEVEGEGVIEGVVNGENEVETVNNEGQNRLDTNDHDVRSLIESGNMEQLAALVLNGEGEKLIGAKSDNQELQTFLDNVPLYMSKINRIHKAARAGSLRDLQAALDRRKFAVARDVISANGATPLHVAIAFVRTSIVRYLAGRFPETVNVQDDNGRTPQHYAAVLRDNGHYYNLLIHLGADNRIKDKFGHTPEYYIKNQSEFNHRQLLLDFGAEDEADEILNEDETVDAEENDSSGQVDMPFFATEEGRYLASSLGDPLIKGLTEVANKRPEDPIAYLATYLYNFARSRDGTKSRGQLQEGQHQQTIVGDAQTAHENQAAPATIDVVTVEPEENSNDEDSAFSNTSRDEHGQSMLHFAAARAHGRNALFQLLLETEINVAYRDELYRTARDISIQANISENTAEIDRYVLHIATKGDTSKLVELLLEGYDHITDIVDEDDTPITDIVAKENQPETVSFLQSILAFEEKRERVHHAIRQGSINEVMALLADENDTGSGKLLAIGKNNYGRCSLHIAVLCQQEEIIDYLANTFPDTLRVGDNLERTALHYAMGVEKMEIITRVLIKAGAKRVVKDLKGRQPTYYFLNKSDILRLQEEEETF